MTMSRRDFIAAVVATPLFSLIGCSGSSLEIYLVLKTLDNPFFTDIQRGVEDSISGSATLIVRAGRNESDISGQRQILEQIAIQIASRGASAVRAGLLLTPSGSGDQLVGAIKRFRDQDIPVVLLDTRIEQAALDRGNTSINLFIGSDNVQGGALAGSAVIDATRHISGRATEVLLLNGAEESETAQTRRAGFLQRMRDSRADITERTARWRRSEAQSIVETLLASGRRFDAIFAANDEMALGVVGAYANLASESRPPIIGFDAIAEARQAVQDGVLLATVAQEPYRMGHSGANALMRGLDPSQPEIKIPVVLVTRR